MNEVKKIDAIPVTEYKTYDKIQMCIDDILKKKKNSKTGSHMTLLLKDTTKPEVGSTHN